MTLRARLILGNAIGTGVLVGVLTGGALALHLGTLRRERDRELVREATRAAERGPRGPGRPFGDGPFGRPPGADRGFDRGFGPGPGGPRPEGPPEQGPPEEGRPDAGRPDAFAGVRRLAEIRRPRFFAPDGTPREPGPVLFPPTAGFADRSLNGDRVRVYTRIDRRGRTQVARETRDIDLASAAALGSFLFGLPVAILLGAGIGAGLTGRALAPVARLADAAGRIGLGRVGSGSLQGGGDRFPAEGDDEFARLSGALNGLLDRLDENAARERRFVADVAHELRTPLARIRATAGAALGSGDPEAFRGALDRADRSAGDLARLVDTLLTLARADAGRLMAGMESVDLRVVVAESLPPEGSPGHERLEVRMADAPVTVRGRADLLERAAANLVENALRHGSGPVRVTVDGTGLTVEDEGPGVPAELVGRLGERFFRADAARSGPGSGLGLALVAEIAAAHGMRAEFGNRTPRGFRAALQLAGSVPGGGNPPETISSAGMASAIVLRENVL